MLRYFIVLLSVLQSSSQTQNTASMGIGLVFLGVFLTGYDRDKDKIPRVILLFVKNHYIHSYMCIFISHVYLLNFKMNTLHSAAVVRTYHTSTRHLSEYKPMLV